MTLLKKSDLQSANSSGTFMSALISDQEDSQELINSIQDFISSSTDHLKGDAYDAVRAHLETYIPILQTRIKVANSIMEAIKAANNSMIDYMEGVNTLQVAAILTGAGVKSGDTCRNFQRCHIGIDMDDTISAEQHSLRIIFEMGIIRIKFYALDT